MVNDDGPADWWCWTEDEPSTFRCRERHHDVRSSRPLLSKWNGDSSTSAQLRQTQRDLAASQADLTQMSALRAEAIAAVRRVSAERSFARTELASARAELAQLRARVAACHVTTCARCHQPVWCNQPREPLPGAKGYFRHATCPTLTQEQP